MADTLTEAPASSRLRSGSKARSKGVVPPDPETGDKEAEEVEKRRKAKEDKRNNQKKITEEDVKQALPPKVAKTEPQDESVNAPSQTKEDAEQSMEERGERWKNNARIEIEVQRRVDLALKKKEEEMTEKAKKVAEEEEKIKNKKKKEEKAERAKKLIEEQEEIKKKKEAEKAEEEKREQEEVEKLKEIHKIANSEEAATRTETSKTIKERNEFTVVYKKEKEVRTGKLSEEENAINSLHELIREHRRNIAGLNDEQKESDDKLAVHNAAQEKAMEDFKAKKLARLEAAHNVDMHPLTQRLRLAEMANSRACTICTNPSPTGRATLIVCGHMMCMICAERLQPITATTIDCPFCRKNTAYVKVYENAEAPVERKRASDAEEATSAKKPKA